MKDVQHSLLALAVLDDKSGIIDRITIWPINIFLSILDSGNKSPKPEKREPHKWNILCWIFMLLEWKGKKTPQCDHRKRGTKSSALICKQHVLGGKNFNVVIFIKIFD